MTAPKSLAAKLAEVGREVAYVQKASVNEGQGYYYASAEDVLRKVNEGLFSRGISVTMATEVLESVTVDRGNKAPMHRVIVRLTATFKDSETGEEVLTQGVGGGGDAGDKAVMKAVTATHKYLYALVFCISWGDDPEASEPVPLEKGRSKAKPVVGGKPKAKPRDSEDDASEKGEDASDEDIEHDLRAIIDLAAKDFDEAKAAYLAVAASVPDDGPLAALRDEAVAALRSAMPSRKKSTKKNTKKNKPSDDEGEEESE